MENKIVGFCNGIIEHESFSLYLDISEFFLKYGYIDGYVNTLQAIYDITKNASYLLKIGDYFRDNGQRELAFSYYNKYFKNKNRDLYNRLEQTKPFPHQSHDPREQYGNDNNLIKLIDKNVLLIHLLNFALSYNLFDIVLDLSENVFILAEKINQYLSVSNNNFANSVNNVYEILEIAEDYNLLSNSLAQIKHHNDINRLAIKLNPNNKLPYFNIMDDFIVYDNTQDAIEFYENVYRKQFPWMEYKNLKQLYTTMHNYFREIGDYYKTVYYQKLIIEEGLKV